MSRPTARCSPTCAHQPATRAAAKAERNLGRSVLRRMATCLGLGAGAACVGAAESEPTIARIVAAALERCRDSASARAIDAALVLSADHELNASTFAARVAASTGADLYSCIGAALATLSGPAHGGACDRVEALVEEVRSPARAAPVICERARLGETIPGFGHPLYPKGDPRFPPLLELALSARRQPPRLAVLTALVKAMRDAGREPPTIDLGLVAVGLSLGLPPGSAAALFAIGRVAGWIAHIQEQRCQGFLIRPRAWYVGA